jgi:hypothetical protein
LVPFCDLETRAFTRIRVMDLRHVARDFSIVP